jgi:hypothetical protein
MALLMGAIVAGVGAVVGGIKGKRQKDTAEDAANESAALQRREAEMNWKNTQEEVRRLGVTHDNILNQAVTDTGAMGFGGDSVSHANRLADVEMEFTAERDYMLEMGTEAKDISDTNASLTSKYGGAGISPAADAIQGAASGFNFGSNLGSAGWWTS